jgi:hypothetical protein
MQLEWGHMNGMTDEKTLHLSMTIKMFCLAHLPESIHFENTVL